MYSAERALAMALDEPLPEAFVVKDMERMAFQLDSLISNGELFHANAAFCYFSDVHLGIESTFDLVKVGHTLSCHVVRSVPRIFAPQYVAKD